MFGTHCARRCNGATYRSLIQLTLLIVLPGRSGEQSFLVLYGTSYAEAVRWTEEGLRTVDELLDRVHRREGSISLRAEQVSVTPYENLSPCLLVCVCT